MKRLPSPAGTVAGLEVFPEIKISRPGAEYARSRGIHPETLERLGVVSGTEFFPELKRTSDCLIFPYTVDGKHVSWKGIAFPDKGFIGQKGGKQAFFNFDKIVAAAPGDIFLTEGELDAASIIEAGVLQEYVTSVPNGAGGSDWQGDSQSGGDWPQQPAPGVREVYPYIAAALKAGLGRHHRFILCGDMDDPGLALRQKLARMLGFAKVWFVDWPEGCKDANDVLRTLGPAALYDLVTRGARPWVIEGVYKMKDLPEPPALTVWDTGFSSWANKIHVAARTLSVVTGQPGHGKTLWTAQLWFQIVQKYNIVAALATYETTAKPEYRRILRTLHSGKMEVAMSAMELAAADRFIDDHYLWLEHPSGLPTLEWLLQMAEVAVVRHGAKIIQIDPWNRLESQRDYREREDEYISRCLKAMHTFAKDMNVHFQIVAHPSKMQGENRNREPDLADIAGAKGWDSIPDQGFIVHRPRLWTESGGRATEARLTHRKARLPALGYDCRMAMVFDVATGRFVDGGAVGQ